MFLSHHYNCRIIGEYCNVMRRSKGPHVKQERYLVRQRSLDYSFNLLHQYLQIFQQKLVSDAVVVEMVLISLIFNESNAIKTQENTFYPSVNSSCSTIERDCGESLTWLSTPGAMSLRNVVSLLRRYEPT